MSSSTAELTSIAALSVDAGSSSDSGTLAKANEECGPLDLARTDVERQPSVDAVAMPGAEHIGDFAQYPVADLGDDPGLLGDRNERRRHAQAVAGMVPAEQR